MSHAEQLANSIVELVHTILSIRDQDPKIIEKPHAGGLLIDKCVSNRNLTFSINENFLFEVYNEEDGTFETHDDVKLALEEMQNAG